jgi:hypothetical protein
LQDIDDESPDDSKSRRFEGESDDDNFDALVCEGWYEPNYISADHGYDPDKSRYMMRFASIILAALFTFRNCTHLVILQRMMSINLGKTCWMIWMSWMIQ